MVKVTVFMAHQCSSTSLSATLEGLQSANLLHQFNSRSKTPVFLVETASIDGQPVQCSGGITFTPDKSIDAVTTTDLIIIPGFLFNILPLLPGLTAVTPWLRQQQSQNTTIAAMCTGAFVAAQAGILDNKLATTHWFYADAFKQRYPRVNLQANHIVTEDHNVICSGGASAGSDMLLHLIRKFGSAELSAECSKKLLIDSSRREQSPYVMATFNKNHQDTDILRVQAWLDEHYGSTVAFDELAKRFGFGVRNFIRRFKDATDQTPIQYLQGLRLEKAKYLLESTKTSIEQITYQVGYEDSNSFRRLFRGRVGISPGAYRKKFQQ